MADIDKLAQQTWWNRPLWGEKSMTKQIKEALHQRTVPDWAIALYNQAFSEAEKLALVAQEFDDPKFTTQEFITLIKTKSSLAKKSKESAILNSSIYLLMLALRFKDSLLQLGQIETYHRSLKQQEFYRYVTASLVIKIKTTDFQEKLQKKLAEINSELTSESEKETLKIYTNILITISAEDTGLKLLQSFKKQNLTNYSVINTVANLFAQLSGKDLHSLEPILPLVENNSEAFDLIGKIIKLPQDLKNQKTYAKIIQYISLVSRHKASYSQFKKLVEKLQAWREHYQTLSTLRSKYNSQEYQQPEGFLLPIPGENLYHKHRDCFEQLVKK